MDDSIRFIEADELHIASVCLERRADLVENLQNLTFLGHP
jgi:hypothetical protein